MEFITCDKCSCILTKNIYVLLIYKNMNKDEMDDLGVVDTELYYCKDCFDKLPLL